MLGGAESAPKRRIGQRREKRLDPSQVRNNTRQPISRPTILFDEEMPLYLLTLFAKNEQENLTKAERNELGKLVDVLVGVWRKG